MRRELRKPLVVGNWKLFKTLAEARTLATAIVERTREAKAADVAVAPVFTALSTVRDATLGTAVGLAAQDVYWWDPLESTCRHASLSIL